MIWFPDYINPRALKPTGLRPDEDSGRTTGETHAVTICKETPRLSFLVEWAEEEPAEILRCFHHTTFLSGN